MQTIEEFCDAHNACTPGRRWALGNCANMPEVWAKAKPNWLVWIASRPGVAPVETIQRFTFWCADRACRIHAPAALRKAGLNDDAEKLAALAPVVDRETAATARDKCRSAGASAAAAASASAAAAASDYAAGASAASDCAAAASDYAASDCAAAASDYAAAASDYAASDYAAAASAAASDYAAYTAERKLQAEWLRENVTPQF